MNSQLDSRLHNIMRPMTWICGIVNWGLERKNKGRINLVGVSKDLLKELCTYTDFNRALDIM